MNYNNNNKNLEDFFFFFFFFKKQVEDFFFLRDAVVRDTSGPWLGLTAGWDLGL